MTKENDNYMGSIIIDKQLIEKAGLEPGKKVIDGKNRVKRE